MNKQKIIKTIDLIFHELNHGSNYGMWPVLNKHYNNWQDPKPGKVGIDDLFLILKNQLQNLIEEDEIYHTELVDEFIKDNVYQLYLYNRQWKMESYLNNLKKELNN